MTDFITITDDGVRITAPMPADETVVEVKLRDGTVCPAWYSQNIQEPGDWDFVAVEPGTDEPDLMADSIAADVIAWRKLNS
jgi:hypothetical protein